MKDLKPQGSGNGESAPTIDAAPDENRVLMASACAGDREAFASLFERYRDSIRRIAMTFVHNASGAEDVVQETFLKGLEAIASYRGEGEPRSWFISIAINICRHALRNAKTGAGFAPTDALDRGRRIRRSRTKGAATMAIQNDHLRLLKLALGYLTEAQREVLTLRFQEGMSYDQIGEILGITAGAARALAHRGREFLRAKLHADFPVKRIAPLADPDLDELEVPADDGTSSAQPS